MKTSWIHPPARRGLTMLPLAFAPVVLALVVLAAHFYRAGALAVAALLLVALVLLAVRRPWAARVLQVLLVGGAIEWARTLAVLAGQRVRLGESVGRLVLILGTVGMLTAGAALIFRIPRVRKHFRLAAPPAAEADPPAGGG